MRFHPMFWLTLFLTCTTVKADSNPATAQVVGEQVDYHLHPIVVTATRTPHDLWETEANVAVITAGEIEQSSALHLGDALKLLPSVNIGEYGSMGQNVSLGIRGSTAGQVLIMVDGVPINDPQLGGLDLNLISLDNVERVEVIRGSASSLYGADALGGVVNIITRSSTYDRPLSDISYQQGDHGLEKIGGRFARRFGQHLGLNLTATSTKTDGFRDNSDFLGRHLTSRLDYALKDWGQVSYSTQIYKGELGVPGMDSAPTPRARQEDRSWNQTLTFQVSPAQGHNLGLILYRNSNRQEYEDPDWFTEAQHRRWVYGIEAQHSFSFRHVHRLTVGGEFQNRRLDSSENGHHDMNRGAALAQDELRLHENVGFRLACRYDYHAQFDDQISPGLTLIWFTGERISCFASIRQSYRAPTFNNLYWPQREYDYDSDGKPEYRESGNVHIKPERAVEFQIGGRAQSEMFTDEVCIFRRDVRNLIQWENIDDSYLYGCWMPVNKSDATVVGMESKITVQIWSHLKAALASTFLDAKDELLDKCLPYQPRYQLFGHLQHEATLFADQLELVSRLEIEHLGERYTDTMESEKVPSNTVINGKVTARALKHFQVYLVAKNLGNKKYFLRSGYPLPGRMFYGGLSWEFWD